MAPKRSYIRAAEVWLPDAAGRLVLGDGLYGDLDAFGTLSRDVTFARGEGLPGQAWAERRPVLMKDLRDRAFLRGAAAEAAGLTCGIALPVLAGDAIRGVAVLFCGEDAETVGAVEVWAHDPDADAQIGLHDGRYGGAEVFETTSRLKRFGRGFGLPGMVWAGGMPLVLRDICRSERFLRHEEARTVGLTLGLGLPFPYDPGRTWVVTVLSALATPIAERVEIWVPDGSDLVFDTGLSEAEKDRENPRRPVRIAPGVGVLGRALASGAPAASGDCTGDSPWLVEDGEAGERPILAIPTLDPGGTVKAVTAWRF